MSLPVRRLLPALLALCASLPFAAAAQAPLAALPAQSDRVPAHADLRASTRLAGHVPRWAAPANDLGPVPDTTSLRLTFVLARSPERQAAFTQFLADQQTPGSPSFHHWLTPAEIGTLYGPTEHDLAALTAWLTAQGLAVTGTAPSRIFVEVEAPAAAVARAFDTSLHYFNLPGSPTDPDARPRLAPTGEPSIPAALAPLVLAISGLADTPVRPMHRYGHAPMPQTATPVPLATSGSTGKHYIAPADFAVLYNLNPAYQAGFNGAGQKVAIVGRSRTLDSDISLYETSSNLPVKQPNVIIPSNAVDPGITNNGDQDEATLDVDRVLGTAPGVQADLILATGATGGIQTGAQYNIQTLLDPVLNISFGACESGAGQSGVTFWDTLFAQAAAEGISVFVSSGDGGPAGCQTGGRPLAGSQPRTINVICASSYVTCVGGTEFADTASPNTWWKPNNGTGLETAISYIPEGAWNEPVDTNNAYVADASGGGASAFIPKPAWQTGPGVPADGARDVPDIAFSTSLHNGYFFCLAYKGDDCVNYIGFFGGTSASTPAMSAIAAIFNGKTGGAQGNLNPLLYRLAATAPAAFHDATPATSGISSCDLNTPSMCNNSIPGPSSLSGGVAGYALTTGYDRATGLGSLDVSAFLSSAAATASLGLSPASPTLTLTQGAASGNTDLLTLSSQVYAGTVALACNVSFNGPGTAASLPICNLNPSTVTVAPNGTATSTLSFATTKPHLIHAALTPLLAPPSPVQAAATTPHPRTGNSTPLRLALCSLLFFALPLAKSRSLRGILATLLLFTGLGTLTACSGSSTPLNPNPLLISTSATALAAANPIIFAGGSDTFTVNVTNTGFNTTVLPTGTVQFYLGGSSTPVTFAPVTAGVATATLPFPTAGAYDLYAVYTGDNSFSGSNSVGAHVVVQTLGTTMGTYTVTVNATAPNGGPTASTSVLLTVQ